MATQGTAPRDAAVPPRIERGWADPSVVPLHQGEAAAPHTKPAVDKASPARGIALGLVISGLLWGVALYAAFRAVH
jgi:hypothetical protein